MTLALLITAVGGAWAQTETLLTTITATAKEQASYSTANVATVSFSNTTEGYSVYNDNWGWWGYGFTATVTAAEGYTITKCVFYDNDGATATDSTDPFIVETEEQNKKPKVNGATFGAFTSAGIKMIEVYGYVTPTASTEPDIEVTTNAAEEGATFTEASFEMPTSDVDVDYELVRDMAQLMTTKVGDAADGADYRIRLRKKDTAWELADIELDELKELITVTDGIENVNLACFGQDAVCTLQIFAIDDNDQPTGDAISFANLEPGRYKAKAVAKADGDYIGETALSNVIVLFQGYEVKVPAKEMITYYKDENLYADQETSADAELYTVSDVSGTTVTLSDAITIVPAYTAMLVYNPTDVTKTFLLIPTEDDADAITPYAGFKGTNEDKAQGATGNGPWRMAANTKYYGCNGNDFVWIKNAGAVAAHRCWIEISTANAPSRLTIVFEKEEATGVNEVSEVNEVSDDSWYDLSGRKLDGEPTEKGVYIKDGKKVVVR